jgi:hypothetical protein
MTPSRIVPVLATRWSIALAAVLAGSAAQGAEISENANMWISYFGDHPLGTHRWGVHLEGQARLAQMGDTWQQILIRPGINYTLTPSITLSGGYCFIEQFPYGEFPVAHDYPIHASWEQVAYTHPAFGLNWMHRARLEQRWIGQMHKVGESWDVADYRYENRVRTMLRTTIPLTRDKSWYVALWDEVFVNFGDNVLRNDFDQNRATIALGRNLSKYVRLEVGFMEQTLQRRGGNVWEHNHTLSVSLFSKAPFGN